jgi:hypothetical protein
MALCSRGIESIVQPASCFERLFPAESDNYQRMVGSFAWALLAFRYIPRRHLRFFPGK